MDLNNPLRIEDIYPQHVLMLRHTPREPRLRKKLPQLAAENPGVFNAYQQTQGSEVEKAMPRAKYLASLLRSRGWQGPIDRTVPGRSDQTP